MEQSGKNLTLLGNDRWKGGATHNASLLKMHENSFTMGYSKITTAALIPAKFGFGAWYDAALRDNQITTVKPAGVGAVPQIAGILTRQPAIASGYPSKNDQVDNENKGLLCKDGYLIYKTGFADTAVDDQDQVFGDVQVGFGLYISDANGRFYFAETGAPPVGHTLFGKVIAMNPDDQSWTVKLTFLGA